MRLPQIVLGFVRTKVTNTLQTLCSVKYAKFVKLENIVGVTVLVGASMDSGHAGTLAPIGHDGPINENVQ